MKPSLSKCGCGVEIVQSGRGRMKLRCDQCRADHKYAYPPRPAYTVTRNCAHCGCEFQGKHIARAKAGIHGIYCSRACRGLSQRRPEQAAENARKGASRRRARKRGATIEDFTHLEVFERDGWKCGLCGKRVDKRLAYPDPMSASLDHIVPLCDGGEHSLRNVQCSHWICNSRKTFGAGGQMRLFG